MLRIHFTRGDLARTRLAAAPDPLWEICLSLHVLRMRAGEPLLDGWRHQQIGLLKSNGRLHGRIDLALAVNPPLGYFPDFLTPVEAAGGLDAGIDAVLSTSKLRLQAEIGMLDAPRGRNRARIFALRDGRHEALTDLGSELRLYHDAALAPVWSRIAAAVDADRAIRARSVLDGGMGALLASLHPSTTFADGVLQVTNYPEDRGIYLSGGGLTIIPSYFKQRDRPMVLADSDLPAVMVYPIDPAAGYAGSARDTPLAALIGRTRAAVLELVALGGSTTEIARRLNVSPPASSQHIAVLRDSGLISSDRADSRWVRHTITPLGRAILDRK